MRKKLVYSLMAAAAVPGAAHADALLKDAVDISKWTGVDAALNGAKTKFLSNNGETITIALGKKAQGSYKLNIADIATAESALTVSVGGKSTTVAQGGNKAEVAFTLASEADVTITVESADKKYFEIGASTLTLVYDFATAKATIQKELTSATNKINAFTNGDKSTYVAQAGTIQKEVNRLVDDDTDGNDSYAAYVKYELWNDIDENNALMKDIADLLNKATYAEQQYLIGEEETKFDATKTEFAKLDADAKAYLQDDYDNIVTLIAAYKADAKTKYDEGEADAFDADGKKLKAIDDAIADLDSKMATDVAANANAWKEIQDNVEAAKGTYLAQIVTALKDADKQVFSYANLLEEGRAQISDKMAKLQQVLEAAEASYKAGTLVADRKATSDKGKNYDADIKTYGDEAKDAYDTYATTLKEKLDGFETEYAAQLKIQTDAEETYKDVIADHATEHNALKNAVAAVKTAIDEANTGDCTALATLDLTDLKKAVAAAKTALDEVCVDAQAKVDAVAAATKAFEDLDKEWADAKTAIAEYKYGETLVSSFFASTIKSIDKLITDEKAAAKKKNEDSKVKGDDTYYTTTLPTNIATIQTAIKKYQDEAKAASENYNTVKGALETAREALATAKAKVENLEIYTDNSQNKDEYNYKSSVEDAEATISAVDNAITAANKLKDYKNTDAVKALTFNPATVNAVVAHIDAQAEADQKAWQANADKQALAAQKQAAKDLQSKLKTDKAEVEAATGTGLAATEIATKLGEIAIPEDAKVTDTALDAYTSEELAELLADLNTAREQMDVVLALVEEAKARVKANDEAKTTATDAVAALAWNKTDVTTAAGTAYTDGTNNEKKEIDDAVKAIDDEVAEIDAAITAAYNTESLAGEYEATIKAQIATAKTNIADAKTLADNLKKNYDAYTTIKTNAAAIGIAAAQAKAKAADAEAGTTYFADKLLGVTYAEELKSINDDNDAQYKAKTAVSAQKGLQALIDALAEKVAAVEQAAKDNKAAYDAQKTLEADVLKTWQDKSVELASGNESSKLKEQQAKLDELLEQLNTQKATDLDDYNNGNAKTNDETNTAELNKIKKAIIDLVEEAMEGYDEQIAADNAGMLDAIAAEKKKAEDAYAAATATINTYKNLKSSEAQAALAAVKTAYDNVTNTLYETPTNMNKTWKAANDEYLATTSPTVFDKDSSYVEQFRTYADNIKKAESDFIAAVKTALNDAVGTKITTYETDLATKKANATKKFTKSKIYQDEEDHVFDTLTELVANAKVAMTSPNVQDLDNALIALENFDSDLQTAWNLAAYYDLKGCLENEKKNVKKAETYYADDADGLEEYNAFKATSLDKAQEMFDEEEENFFKSADMATVYDAIRTLINTFQDKAQNPYLKATANDTEYNKIVADIATMQEYLDAAIESVKDYGCIETLKTQANGFNAQQTGIDEKTAAAEEAKEAGTAKYNKNDLTNFKKAVDAIVAQGANLKTTEKAYLDERIQDLKAEYNRYTAKATTEEIEAEKKVIDDLVTAITKDAGDSKKKASDLLAYEAQIKAELAKLVEANDGEAGQEAYRAALNNSIDEVAAKAVFADDINEDVKAEYQDEMDALVANIEAVKAEIAASENPAYDTDRIEAEIAALDKEVDALQTEIAAADAKAKADIAANEANYEANVEVLNELKQMVTDSKDKLDAYEEESAKAANFQAKYQLIENEIAEAEALLEELYAAGKCEAPDAAAVAKVKDEIAAKILEIEDAAANREINAELKALQAVFETFNAIAIDESNYTPTDLKTIKDGKTDIQNRIYGTYTNYGYLTKNGLVQDIANDLTNVTSETNLATRQTEIQALLDKMDDIKKVINENQLTPDEPETIIPGDITGTGEVTDADFDKFVEDYLAGNVPGASDPNFAAYDANQDGVIDIADVQAIFNLSMGLNADGSDPASVSAPAFDMGNAFEPGTMNVEATKLSNGNTQLAIQLNSTANYRAFAMDIVLADGMSVVSENANLELLRSNDLGNIHRIVGYGQVENNGTMLTIEVAGNGNVFFKSVTLATEKAESVDFELGKTTGIEAIGVDQNEGNSIFDLGGKLMNGIKKGINIIRGKNGETKKVIK